MTRKRAAGRFARALAVVMLLSLPAVRAVPGTARMDSLMRLAGNIHQFNSIFPQEKVYLQFDNTSYYIGETIWFKAFVSNASSLGRAQSKVLYVDLISPDGVLLNREKLKIVAGQADGSLPLMDGSTAQARDLRGVLSFPSGFYEIRAYTSWMLNFHQENVFSRVFAVYEKPKEEGHYYDMSPVVTIKKSALQQKRPETPRLRNLNASFHPEGGHLVMGVPNRVAFKVTDENGFGTDAVLTVKGHDASAVTEHDGMGVFTFTPTSRRNSVEITADGTSRSFDLPDAENEGLSVKLEEIGTDSLSITLYPSAAPLPDTLGMTVTCRGELMDFAAVPAGGQPYTHTLSLYGIPEGICRMVLFDEHGNIYATRSFYHRSTTSFPPVLTVTPDKNRYGFFDRIRLDLDLKDSQGNALRDRFCLAVRDVRGQGNPFSDDIRTSMLLSSDLRGLIERPSWYFESDDPEHLHALDLLCMVQGWERYDWRVMTGLDEFKEVHRLEESLTLNGWILNPAGRKPMADVNVTASLMPVDKTLTESYSYTTDSTGYFGFNIGVDFYEKARFTIRANTPKERLIGTSARIMFERSIMPDVRAYYPGETVFRSLTSKKPSSGQKREAVQDDGLPTVINVDNGFLLPDVEIEERRKYVDYYTFNAFDVTKDVELDLDKGEFTTDVEGYLIEKGYQLIDTINDDGDYMITEINGFEPFFYVHNSTVFRNTGIFSNPGTIDSRDIKSILVYDRPVYKREAWLLAPLYMDYMKHTVTNLEERTEEEYDRVIMVDILLKEDHQLSSREDRMKIDHRVTTAEGWSTPYSFYAPTYPDGPVFGDVDYRRTLYWNPNVVTDSVGHAQVEFYNSSITEHINISAAGMTSTGLPYTLDANY
ncbi:MAG: hypothetical protein J5869_05950 [Bacteroidaceae bacterium]|nr:hypothetical protein [Bacteroidaceae bacterium]